MRHIRFRDSAGFVRMGEWIDETARSAGKIYELSEIDVLTPTEPSKVIGVGLNYESTVEGDVDHPLLFWKGGQNVVSSHGDTVILPNGDEVIYEAELGVVIGQQCRNVSADGVDDVIAGYTCVNDISNQDHTGDTSVLRVKSFDNSAPMGPVITDPEHVPANPRIRLWVNDEKRQDSAGDDLHFSVNQIIEFVSRYVTLESGDVVMMGTPSDYGPLSDGDHVRIEIEGVGTLEHDVRMEG